MIGTITIRYNAQHPNMPLHPFFSFIGSPSMVKVADVPKKIGLWQITNVYVKVTYPDNTIHWADCTLSEGVYVATLPACWSVGKSPDGYSIIADGIDENGQAVTGYVLGKGDCTILDTDFEVKSGEHTYYVHYQEVVPENPHKGDVTGFADGFRMYDGNRWREFVEVIDYNRLENKPKINGMTLQGDVAGSVLLSAELEKKRDIDDLSATSYEWVWTDWVCDPALPDGYTIGHYYSGEESWCPMYYGMQEGMSQGNLSSDELTWNEYDWSHGFRFTAKRQQVKRFRTETFAFQSEVDKKRDNDDLAVQISSDEWNCDPALPDGWRIGRSDYGEGWMPIDNYGYQVGSSQGDNSSLLLTWLPYDWAGGYELTARRKWVDDDLAVVGQIPTKLSQLSNDVAYETSAVVDLKRNKDDLSAYKMELGDWRCEPALPDGWRIAHLYDGDSSWCPVDEYGSQQGASKGDEGSKQLTWVGWGEWAQSFTMTATRRNEAVPLDDKLVLSSELSDYAKKGDNSNGYNAFIVYGSDKSTDDELSTSTGHRIYSQYGSSSLKIDGLVTGEKFISLTNVKQVRCIGGDKAEYGAKNDVGTLDWKLLSGEYELSADTFFRLNYTACLDGSTMILLADGTEKRIDQLTLADKVMTFNPWSHKLEADDLIYVDGSWVKYGDQKDIWTFDDGTQITTIQPHEFYNLEQQRFMYIADFKVGDRIYKSDGSSAGLVDHKIVEEKTRHFTIFTKRFNNYFANGILTGNRRSVRIAMEQWK